MLDFYRRLLACLEQGPVVVATVAAVRGSVPRQVGAKMLVWEDGQSFGTVGGGAGEAKVIGQALRVLGSGEKGFVEIDLSGQGEGVCGGRMRVWVERWQGPRARTLAQRLVDLLAAGKSGRLVTPFVLGQDPHLAVSGHLADPDALIEMISPSPTLLIVGGGHVALSLAHIAALAEFRVVVQDDRPEFANAERFPTAAQILARPLAAADLAGIEPLYVALVTRGLLSDLAALRALAEHPGPVHYLGMIGSQKRVQTVWRQLQKEGILSMAHAPIGLDIGAETPAEIAVSIVAELIKVRRGGSGRSLSEGNSFQG